MLQHCKTSVLAGLLIVAVFLQAEERPAKKRVAPAYPELAKKMHISGAVKLELDVDPEGQVKDVKVVLRTRLAARCGRCRCETMGLYQVPAKSVEVIEVNFRQE